MSERRIVNEQFPDRRPCFGDIVSCKRHSGLERILAILQVIGRQQVYCVVTGRRELRSQQGFQDCAELVFRIGGIPQFVKNPYFERFAVPTVVQLTKHKKRRSGHLRDLLGT